MSVAVRVDVLMVTARMRKFVVAVRMRVFRVNVLMGVSMTAVRVCGVNERMRVFLAVVGMRGGAYPLAWLLCPALSRCRLRISLVSACRGARGLLRP